MSIIISQVPLVLKNPLNRFALQDTLCSILYVCFAFFPLEKKIMEDILKELHLESLIPHFLAERIEPANVVALSDEELCCVGVTTIGDRLKKNLFLCRGGNFALVAISNTNETNCPTPFRNCLFLRSALLLLRPLNGAMRSWRTFDATDSRVRSFSATAQKSQRRGRSPIVVTPTRQSSLSDNAATFAGSIRSAKKWGIRDCKCNSFKMSSMIFFSKGRKAKHT